MDPIDQQTPDLSLSVGHSILTVALLAPWPVCFDTEV